MKPKHHMGASTPILMLLMLLGLVLAACGASSDPAATSEPGDQAQADDPVEVEVTLDEFKIEMSKTRFQAGVPYRFVVTNNGEMAHELMLLPPVEPGAMDMEEMDGMAVAMLEDEELTSGATVEKTVTFPDPGEGSLEAACHLPGHYEAGMKLPIEVTG